MSVVRVQSLGVPGGGPALILLPGIVGDGDVFQRLEHLGTRGPVHAVDLPADASLDRLEAIAAAVAPALPPGPLVVAGVSLGGLVARALARQLGERVLGSIGVGALPHPRHLPARLRRLRALVRPLPSGLARRAWSGRLERAMAREGIPAAERGTLLRRLPSAAVALARLDAVLGLAPDVGPLPVAWFRGQHDVEAPWTVADATRDLPGVAVSTIPGGHRAHWTHPRAFSEQVGDWWMTLARTTR